MFPLYRLDLDFMVAFGDYSIGQTGKAEVMVRILSQAVIINLPFVQRLSV